MSERILVTGGSGFIGSHLIGEIEKRGHLVANLDVKAPLLDGHYGHWRPCDIKNFEELLSAFHHFEPTRVIHLAAKANLNGRTLDDFPDNIQGTANVIECVNRTEGVALFINTSTQYVVRPGVCPEDDAFLEPYTSYGESKAVAERMVRDNCRRDWVIIRPTNIWGPLHPHFPFELWRYLERGYYVHPGFKPIYKHYCYVRNAVQQILHIALTATFDQFAHRAWYITDGVIDNAIWMDRFSLALRGKRVRRVPLSVWRCMATIGDAARRAGFNCPVNTDRLFRLTVNETLPTTMTVAVPNYVPTSIDEGIEESVTWYRSIAEQLRERT